MYAIFSVFAKPIAWLLLWLYDLVGSYGIAIIILTLIIRTLLFPLYLSQMKQSANMSSIQPKMQQLQKQYGNDKEKYNQKVMELYQEEGVNPMRGCLPLLIQMPILFGLFAALRNPLQYTTNPDAILSVHESFLWVQDLSQPDKWILPILAGITTYFSYRITASSNPQTASSMKVLQYIFPLMIVWWGRSFPAGLTIYWFIGTLYMCIQQKVVMTYLNKKKAEKEAQEQYEKEHPELFPSKEEEDKEKVQEASASPKKNKIVEEDDWDVYDVDVYESQDDYRDFYTDAEWARIQQRKNQGQKKKKNQHKKKHG